MSSPQYCKQLEETINQYFTDFHPHQAQQAITRLLIHAIEQPECYLSVEETDALKGLNRLLSQLQEIKGMQQKEETQQPTE